MKINDKEFVIEMKGKTYHCAMDISMSYIGGKWKTVVLWYLKSKKRRFGELRKLCPQVTERMLSITLKQLEEDGLVIRKVYSKKPPLKVEYSLTEFGQSLIPMLEEIAKWGREVGIQQGALREVNTIQ
ncbi:MAG: helix-turn-helix transcriptional regulator [Lewinella sp.]|nr:helix-turn-helix transcriptional regulator [Lewinella sp.]